MKYCSLDLEGTGLDPKKDAITEVGAVLFEIKDGRVRFEKEFSQLIKPPIPIPEFIQDLTNIREADVKDAPTWPEILPKFKKFVGDYVILGQNIQFDLAFLAANGLELKQESIDTKELAQIFLPDAQYYNLEYLMGFFNLPLETHHRATEDAKSTVLLLNEIVNSYAVLPAAAKKVTDRLLKTSKLPYKDLFLSAKPVESNRRISKKKKMEQGALFDDAPKISKQDPVDFSFIGSTAPVGFVDVPLNLQNRDSIEQLLVSDFGKKQVVVSLPNQDFSALRGSAERLGFLVVDEPSNYLCEYRLNNLIKAKHFSKELTEFLMKVIVWKNSDHNGDLSALFLSGPDYFFKKMISGDFGVCRDHKLRAGEKCLLQEKLKKLSQSGKILTNHFAWQDFVALHPSEKLASGIFWNTELLEQSWIARSSKMLNQKNLLNVLNQLDNSQTKSGLLSGHGAAPKEIIREAIDETDLAFGLLSMSLNSQELGISQRVVDEDLRSSEIILKPQGAFEKLIKKLDAVHEVTKKKSKDVPGLELISRELENFVSILSEFFLEPGGEKIYWIDLFNNQTKLKFRPKKFSLQTLGKFDQLFITGNFSSEKIKNYYKDFFGMTNVEVLDVKHKKIKVEICLPKNFPFPKNPNAQKITFKFLESVLPKFLGRTLVLFNSQKNLEQTYQMISKSVWKKRVVAQRVSGHQWKNCEFYQTKENAIWFVTTQNFIRSPFNLPPSDNLILIRIPYDVPGILEVLYDRDEVFSEYIIPKTIIKMATIFSRFINSGETKQRSKRIIFLDQRVTETYNEVLLDPIDKYFQADYSEFSESDPEKLTD